MFIFGQSLFAVYFTGCSWLKSRVQGKEHFQVMQFVLDDLFLFQARSTVFFLNSEGVDEYLALNTVEK
ncbi:hypothetical protein SAMN04488084_102425 [Pedobacter antarcticus]|uniref:Uncharacterized protein n=1 Tax=Pedobacter antarcticus TaxID=34086 RepID=A0A1I2F4G8_9SPHI|nr:hypothetical protein SAMN04488084_102425 [Pedobacter antarcticus]SFE99410.1 hypothetical protein SAMN03003324_01995 [Pedobacter antarcticus]